MLPLEGGLILYKEDEEKIELYLPKTSGYILKSIYLKQGTEQDLIWKDDYLKRAIRIISIDKGDITFKIAKEGGE